jgi:tetratricopeptide (TPR) repeat protein/serine/threonine protein kinase
MAEPLPQEEAIFHAALAIAAAEQRSAYLDAACGDRHELRRRVEALLDRCAQAQGPLDRPPVPSLAVTTDEPLPERPGTVIGPYKLMEQVGEGGMGLVFVAEQQQPVRRKVALKVLKPGMDSRQVIARFEAERQALAIMDHPNIATVHDGGQTAGGRPYFVMELVKGVPITAFCDDNRLPPRARLELFVAVCSAVQHAHTKGIIHRDLKPSNVLLTSHDGVPVVKVIDFGIAKAVGQQLTDKTVYTALAQLIGTPLYMSPEQAGQSGLDIDTRSDIYSLGVLLYELLTGTTPFDGERLRRVGFDEMRRIIREEEPPRPSTRLSTLGQASTTISAQRKSDPKRLSQLCRGELDCIVMKCLEKDRSRRYETASALAADVLHYLHDEPVEARPPSAWYRLRKFVRRHRTAVAIAAVSVVAVLLAVGSLAGSIGWVVRDQAARRASTEQEVEPVLAEATRLLRQRNWPAALAQARRAEGRLGSEAALPELRQRVRDLLDDLRMVARFEEARIRQTRLKEKENLFDLAAADAEYARAFREYGIDVEALGPAQAAGRLGARDIRVELAAALDDWAHVRRVEGKKEETWKPLLATARLADPDPWRNRLRDAWERNHRQALKDLADSAEVGRLPATTLSHLGRALRQTGAVEKAVVVLRRAQQRHPGDFWINDQLARSLEALRPPQGFAALRYWAIAVAVRPQSPGAQVNLGAALRGQGLPDEAVAAFWEALRLQPDYAAAHTNLGIALLASGRPDEALSACRKAIELKPDDAKAHNNLGIILHAKGRREEAIAAYRKAIELNPALALTHHNLGVLLKAKGLHGEALAAFRRANELKPDYAEARDSLRVILNEGRGNEALAGGRKASERKPGDATAYFNQGVALDAKGRHDEAIASFRKAIELNPALAAAHNNLGGVLYAKGRDDEAITAYRRAIELKPTLAETHYNLGVLLNAKDRREEAIAAFRKAIALKPALAEAHLKLGAALGRKGQYDQALDAFRKVIALQPDSATGHDHLGLALKAKGRHDEALAAFRKAIALKPDYVEAHLHLGSTLIVTDRYDEAITAFRRATELKPTHAESHYNLGVLLNAKGRREEAIAAFRRAIALKPAFALAHDRLAWLLATCPEPKLRDPGRAVKLAQKATALAPTDGLKWTTLGVAHYRAGDWRAALAALEKGTQLRKGNSGYEWFFLAMAHRQLGNTALARACYDRAVQWLEKNRETLGKNKRREEELRRFHREAAELLGIPGGR